VTAPGEHLGLEEIAALEAGASTDERPVREHLDACPECQRQARRLADVRAELRALPQPAMPSDVALRIDDALAAARTGTQQLASVLPVRRRRWRAGPVGAGLSAAAAAAALIAAVAVGAIGGHHHNGRGSGAAGVRAGASAGAFPVTASGQTYTDSNAGELLAALDPAGPHRPGALAGAQPKPAAAAPVSPAVAAVPRPLRPLFLDRQSLLRCVARLEAGGPVTLPRAIDFARFTGGNRHLHDAPAIVIVLPGPGGRDVAYIVGPACLTDPSDDIYVFHTVAP
jgi:hypothetical protein